MSRYKIKIYWWDLQWIRYQMCTSENMLLEISWSTFVACSVIWFYLTIYKRVQYWQQLSKTIAATSWTWYTTHSGNVFYKHNAFPWCYVNFNCLEIPLVIWKSTSSINRCIIGRSRLDVTRLLKISHAHLRSSIAVTYRSAPSRMRIRESSLGTRLTVWRTLIENIRLATF